MYRLFIGIPVPDDLKTMLTGMRVNIPGARWIREDQMHITLKFIGEVDGAVFSDIRDGLKEVGFRAFTLRFMGAGFFPQGKRKKGRGIRVLWTGVDTSVEIGKLRNVIEKRLSDCGILREQRKFFPHLTLARLKNPPEQAVAGFMKTFSGFVSDPFSVDRFVLYSSLLRPDGPVYTEEMVYPLGGD